VVHGAGVRTAYAAYECDIVEVFSKPALADLTVAATRRFHEALARVEDARTGVSASASKDNVDRYADAVTAVERAWQEAHAYATRRGLGLLPIKERRSVEKAIRLLHKALDTGSPDVERQMFYT